jgi:hypothetical protein
VGKTFNLYSTSTENNQKLNGLHCPHQRRFHAGLTGRLVIGCITFGVPCIGGLDGLLGIIKKAKRAIECFIF